MNTERIGDRVAHAYEQGREAVVALVVEIVAELTTESVRLAALEAANVRLRTEHTALRARLGTDSHNSSKPPSSDGPGVKPHPKEPAGGQWASSRWLAGAPGAHPAAG